MSVLKTFSHAGNVLSATTCLRLGFLPWMLDISFGIEAGTTVRAAFIEKLSMTSILIDHISEFNSALVYFLIYHLLSNKGPYLRYHRASKWHSFGSDVVDQPSAYITTTCSHMQKAVRHSTSLYAPYLYFATAYIIRSL